MKTLIYQILKSHMNMRNRICENMWWACSNSTLFTESNNQNQITGPKYTNIWQKRASFKVIGSSDHFVVL